MKISEALDSIRKCDLVLPEFQREYVWTREKAKQLMISLVRGYPVGGLLIWKTDKPPELKNISKLPDKLGLIQVLLDGQQRLTTLHMLTTGEIPAYYTSTEIENDPRELYYNLESGDFQYYQPSRMQGDPLWRRVVDCFKDSTINPFEIAQMKGHADKAAFEFAQTLNTNLNRIRAVKDMEIPEQIVPHHASLDQAIDIFDRVNSLGTKLTDAELALTHVTAKWPTARREMKAKIDECTARGFNLGLTFMTRALTVVVTNRALFETIHNESSDQLKEGWRKLTKVVDYLLTLLPQRAFIHSTDDLNTSNALIPLISYLSVNNGKFPNEDSIKHAVNWLYAALMWARYTSQTDQRLEADVALVAKDSFPWNSLRSAIIDQRGRIRVEPSDLAGRGAQSPFYRATFILAKAHNAVDWFNGLPICQTHGKAYGIHSHHIFPQSVLYGCGLDPDDYTHRQLVNEIANRAFITADSNYSLSDESPEDYLPRVQQTYPGALVSQFIPIDRELWKVENYREFLEARRSIIVRKLNEFMDSLTTLPEKPHHRPIEDLIKLGESYTLEFKSTFQWDVVQQQQNKALRMSSLKTIAAFCNSQGGTLVIGVEDDGSIFGLDKDLKFLDNSLDRFGQLIASLITDYLGASVAPYYKIRFQEIQSNQVCILDVERTPEPIFAKTEKGREFFVRVGNTTRALDAEETHRYVEMNWT